MFQSKVALVTGGTSGIGRATSIAFGRYGARVVVSGRSSERGDAVVNEIRNAGGEAEFITADLLDIQEMDSLFEKIKSRYGRLDIAFNNAGIVKRRPLIEMSPEEWDLVMNINLRAVWMCMTREIQQMVLGGGGSIVNMSSVSGLVGNAWGTAAYIVSKHGVVGLTRAAALEYAAQGIRVNSVCPGVVRTEMTEKMLSGSGAEQYGAMHPLGRVATPDEVAETVVWLCSSRASFITGVALPVDGGITAG